MCSTFLKKKPRKTKKAFKIMLLMILQSLSELIDSGVNEELLCRALRHVGGFLSFFFVFTQERQRVKQHVMIQGNLHCDICNTGGQAKIKT